MFVGDLEICEGGENFVVGAFDVDEVRDGLNGFFIDLEVLEFFDEFGFGDFFGVVDDVADGNGFLAEAEGVEEAV